MKIRLAILVVVSALLLGGSVALAQSGGPSGYIVEPGAASGESYHLTSLAWQLTGTTSGGDYRLQGAVQPLLRSNGCCCTWLPSLMRQ